MTNEEIVEYYAARDVCHRHGVDPVLMGDKSIATTARALLALEARIADTKRERDEAREQLDIYHRDGSLERRRLARIEKAAGEAEQEARHSATLPACPTCDPGNESAEVWGEIAATLRTALALPGAEGREGEK